VVRQHEGNLDRQRAAALPEEQVVEAVARLRHEHEGAQRAPDRVDAALHAVAVDDRLQRGEQGVVVGVGLGLQAQEEPARAEARELLQLGDVALGLDDGARHGVHDAGAVVADQGHDPVVEGLAHASSLLV